MLKKLRKCLGPECDKLFLSLGIGNRLCKECSKKVSLIHSIEEHKCKPENKSE